MVDFKEKLKEQIIKDAIGEIEQRWREYFPEEFLFPNGESVPDDSDKPYAYYYFNGRPKGC